MRNFVVGLVLGMVALNAWAAPKVIVVGGGGAGLLAADLLRKAGIEFVLLESSAQTGGRLSSRPASGDLDLTLDDGANLINSNDRVTLSVIKELGIDYVQRVRPGGEAWAFHINGISYSQYGADKYLFASNARALQRIAHDQQNRDEDMLLNTSIERYLKNVEADRTLTNLVRSFFWSEYGRGLEELNVSVLFDYVLVDGARRTVRLIPYFDEAYTIPGGAGQITEMLTVRNRSRIKLQHKTTKIVRGDDGLVHVTTQTPDGTQKIFSGDYVLYAAPMHALNEIEVRIPGITEEMLEQARSTMFARGVKLHLKFKAGFRELYKFRGIYMTDTGEQIWTSMQGQPGEAGLLTVLTGPLSTEEQSDRIARILKQLETFAPGVSALYVGAERSEAPFSYSGPTRPGEIRGLEINSAYDTQFIAIGEASGGYFQGYLEGALRSSRLKTNRLIRKLKRAEHLCAQAATKVGA